GRTGDHEETYAAGQRCRPGSLVPERLRNHGDRRRGPCGVRAACRRRGAVSLRVGLVALPALRGGTPLHGRARPCNDPGSPLLPVLWAVPCVHPQRQRQAPRLVQTFALKAGAKESTRGTSGVALNGAFLHSGTSLDPAWCHDHLRARLEQRRRARHGTRRRGLWRRERGRLWLRWRARRWLRWRWTRRRRTRRKLRWTRWWRPPGWWAVRGGALRSLPPRASARLLPSPRARIPRSLRLGRTVRRSLLRRVLGVFV